MSTTRFLTAAAPVFSIRKPCSISLISDERPPHTWASRRASSIVPAAIETVELGSNDACFTFEDQVRDWNVRPTSSIIEFFEAGHDGTVRFTSHPLAQTLPAHRRGDLVASVGVCSVLTVMHPRVSILTFRPK